VHKGHGKPALLSSLAMAGGQVGFARAGRSNQDDPPAIVDLIEVAGQKVRLSS